MSADPPGPTRAAHAAPHRRRGLRFLPLVSLVYALSCAGPFGIEEIVAVSGPGLTALLLLLVPILYGLPLGLASGEMNSRFPVEGGYYRWVRIMFGDFWGFQAGWCAWLGGLCDGAACALLVYEYSGAAVGLLPEAWQPSMRFVIPLVVIVACTWANLRGIELVGWSNFVFLVFVLSPFLVLCTVGLAHWTHNPLLPWKPPDQGWLKSLGVGTLIAMWSYSGYESLSTAAEELEDPRRNYLRAILITIAVTVPTYLLPMLVSLAATSDWTSFAAGAFTDAGSIIGGPLLASWIGVAGMVASLSMFNAYTLSYSRIPFAMAQDGFLPRGLARTHPKHGTPWVALLTGGVIYAALTLIPSEKIIQALLVLEMWCFSVLYILLYIALWRVRVRPMLDPGGAAAPGASAPAGTAPGASESTGYRFVIPLGVRGIWLVTLPPIILIVMAMFGSGEEYVRYGAPAILSGVVLYPLAARLRRRRPSPPAAGS